MQFQIYQFIFEVVLKRIICDKYAFVDIFMPISIILSIKLIREIIRICVHIRCNHCPGNQSNLHQTFYVGY